MGLALNLMIRDSLFGIRYSNSSSIAVARLRPLALIGVRAWIKDDLELS